MSLPPPGFIQPCLPTVSRLVPNGPQCAFEIKHDGFRFICLRDGKRVRGNAALRSGLVSVARPHRSSSREIG